MGRRLSDLSRRIESEFRGAKTRWYVDTGPVLERELAAASGLGAVGKNTCLLHPEAGSWFFLGQILTSLDLEPLDQPLADQCGSCNRCLQACPTGALQSAYELDANLCISYWTIEHRGEIPAEMRPLLGDWVFGCDVCQEVCPHNEGALPASEPDFDLRGERRQLSLGALLRLDTEGYRRLFRGSPMKRAKERGLKRNAIVAMGNGGDSSHVDALLEALTSPDDLLRSHAAWALGRIGEGRAGAGLQTAAEQEANPAVRAEIEAALELLQEAS